jgi:glycosidase
MLLKGTPLIYYGQELGMRGKPDPRYQSDEKDIGDREAFEWTRKTQAPGQANWYKGPKSYWTARYARDDDGISVAEEVRDKGSLLNFYRRLLALRKSHLALSCGTEEVLPSPGGMLVVERRASGERIEIISNLANESARIDVSGRDLMMRRPVLGGLELGPYETRVIAVRQQG